jgi:hypothetical protein
LRVLSRHMRSSTIVKEGEKGLVLQLDYKKAYDKLDWSFFKKYSKLKVLVANEFLRL